jgi:hypothetical protein
MRSSYFILLRVILIERALSIQGNLDPRRGIPTQFPGAILGDALICLEIQEGRKDICQSSLRKDCSLTLSSLSLALLGLTIRALD